MSGGSGSHFQRLGDHLIQRHRAALRPRRREGFLAQLRAAPVFVIGGVLTGIVALLALAHPAIRTLD